MHSPNPAFAPIAITRSGFAKTEFTPSRFAETGFTPFQFAKILICHISFSPLPLCQNPNPQNPFTHPAPPNRLSPSTFAKPPFSLHFSQTAFTRPLFAMGFLLMHPLPFWVPLYLPFSFFLPFLSSPFTFFNRLSKISLFFFSQLLRFLSPSLLPILFLLLSCSLPISP
jgi:hypothetical protein